MKKKLALLLAIVMTLSLFTGIVSAKDASALENGTAMVKEVFRRGDDDGDTNFGVWGDASENTTDAYSGSKCREITAGAGYKSMCMWTGGNNLEGGKTYLLSFYVKGAAGETVLFDFNDGGFGGGSHVFAADDTWEAVSKLVSPTETKAGDGHSFRIYTNDSAPSGFKIDEITITEVSDVVAEAGIQADEWFFYYDGTPDAAPFGKWGMDSASFSAVDGASGTGCRVTKAGANNGVYFWTGGGKMSADNVYFVYFYAMGTKDETIMFDMCDGRFAGGSYTFKETGKWELVTVMLQPTSAPQGAAEETNGYSFRIYGSPAEFCIDEMHICSTTPVLPPDPLPPLTDLAALEENKDGGFTEVQSKGLNNYAAMYWRANMEAGKTYTISADVMSNNLELNLMVDLEGQGGVGAQSMNPSAVDTWETKSVTVTPNADGSFPVRVYLNQTDGKEGEMLVKNLCVKNESGNTVAEFTGKEAPVDGVSWVAGNAKYYEYKGEPAPEPEYTNLFKEDSCKDGGFMAFEPDKDSGYAAYYMRAKLNPNEEYTLEFKTIANVPGSSLLVDLEGNGGVGAIGVGVNETDKWESKSVKIKTSDNWKDAGGDIAEMGWPLRIYNVNPVDSQIFIDEVVLKDSKGNEVFSQNFDKNEIEDVVTWMSGKATYIPAGFVPEEEGEILGYNELINGDFEDASKMNYWWSRSDWNGGYWQREEGKGYNGTAGLVAHGSGSGLVSENAGCFYTIAGEGNEASLSLKAGKTYVLTYKVFRPEGVDSYTYIDINEGQVTTAAATKNGEWETVTARFVAPEGAVKIRLVANGLATGKEVYVDDIELREVGGDPNGSPETGDNTPVALMVLGAVVSAGAACVIIAKKKLAK